MYYPFTGDADELYLSLEGRICSEEEELESDGTHMAYRGYRMIPLVSIGTKDSIGKYVYDGDVIRISDNHSEAGEYVVRYENFQWVLREDKYLALQLYIKNKNFLSNYGLVVGNIYENPGYLKILERE